MKCPRCGGPCKVDKVDLRIVCRVCGRLDVDLDGQMELDLEDG